MAKFKAKSCGSIFDRQSLAAFAIYLGLSLFFFGRRLMPTLITEPQRSGVNQSFLVAPTLSVTVLPYPLSPRLQTNRGHTPGTLRFTKAHNLCESVFAQLGWAKA